jgi:O-antigen ligase
MKRLMPLIKLLCILVLSLLCALMFLILSFSAKDSGLGAIVSVVAAFINLFKGYESFVAILLVIVISGSSAIFITNKLFPEEDES